MHLIGYEGSSRHRSVGSSGQEPSRQGLGLCLSLLLVPSICIKGESLMISSHREVIAREDLRSERRSQEAHQANKDHVEELLDDEIWIWLNRIA
jgi:hypothetical protein